MKVSRLTFPSVSIMILPRIVPHDLRQVACFMRIQSGVQATTEWLESNQSSWNVLTKKPRLRHWSIDSCERRLPRRPPQEAPSDPGAQKNREWAQHIRGVEGHRGWYEREGCHSLTWDTSHFMTLIDQLIAGFECRVASLAVKGHHGVR